MTPIEMLKEVSREIWEGVDPYCNDDCCKPWRELARKIDCYIDTQTEVKKGQR